jgi:SAM-dependent methyltransferase
MQPPAHPQQVKWDARYREVSAWPEPAKVLRDYQHLLPAQGRTLEIACGLGSNALLLAQHGLHVSAWDISPVAIGRLQQRAAELHLEVNAAVRDVEQSPPPPGEFDVIVISHFLHRPLFPFLRAALRPGGLFFYQTFTRDRVDDIGPRNPDYRLAENELLALCTGLTLRAYREEGRCGDLAKGMRNEALLVAQK